GFRGGSVPARSRATYLVSQGMTAEEREKFGGKTKGGARGPARPIARFRLLRPTFACSLFDRNRHGRLQAHGQRRAGLQDDGIAVAGRGGGGAGAGAGGGADRGALRAAQNRSDDRAADRASTDFGAAAGRGALALTEDRLGVDRHARAVGEDQRVEPDAEPRALLEFAALFHKGDGADRARAGGDGDAVRHAHVAGDARFDAVLDARGLRRYARFGLQADHRIARHDELFELLLRRFGCGGRRRTVVGLRGLGRRRRRRRGGRLRGRRPGARQRRRLRRRGAGALGRGGVARFLLLRLSRRGSGGGRRPGVADEGFGFGNGRRRGRGGGRG